MTSPFRAWIARAAGIVLALALFTGAAPAVAEPLDLGGIHVAIVPPAPCANDAVSVEFTTCACATQFTSAGPSGSGVRLNVAVDPTIVCVRCDSLDAVVPLGRFAAGSYSVQVHITVLYGRNGAVDSTRYYDGQLDFQVGQNCNPPPGVPYLDFVQVGGVAPCRDCQPIVCPGDSIPVFLGGNFPDTCFGLDSIAVVPPPYMSPLPFPDIVRIYYHHDCGPCALVMTPWAAQVRIGPLPPRSYGLRIEAYEAVPCSTEVAMLIGTTAVPFTVADSCPPPPPPIGCYVAGFEHVSGTFCDAAVAPNQPANVTLAVRTSVALAGLQGRFTFDTPGLAVTGLATVGVASGMVLSWQPTATGADFVLFAPSGAPIGPTGVEPPTPVLRAEVSAVPGQPVPAQARLVPSQLVASDADGHFVPLCPDLARTVFVDPAARLCRASACDFNGDGTTDVRDLVIMARCILDTSFECPPGAADHLDCNADSVRDLGDVLCCARILLGGLRRPDDGLGRPAPEVQVVFGAPQELPGGLALPLTITGLAGVGAGRVDLTYPYPDFEALAIDQAAPAGQGWLAFSQAARGVVALGFVGLGANAADTLRLVVPFVRQDGAGATGEVAIAGGEFAGTDGAALTVPALTGSVSLAPPAAVVLSAPRPNPFRDATAFTVTLAAPRTLDVTVYDLLGRRVANLFHGPAPAGPTGLTWDRTRSDGARVGTGVYFLRVTTADGLTVGRKVLVLSRE